MTRLNFIWTIEHLKRFWSKVNFNGPNGCWIWTAYCKPQGYGHFWLQDTKTRRAHRLAYKLCVGEIPEGLQVLHECDNPPCVNPKHLSLGTNARNAYEKIQRGRWRGGRPTLPETVQQKIQQIARSLDPWAPAREIQEILAAEAIQVSLPTISKYR